MSNETPTARRNKPFVSSLRAWIGFLTRPRRSTFPDSFVRRYALWLLIAIILVAGSMIALDQWTINAVAKLPAWVNRGFKQLTDFGRSGWFLVPWDLAFWRSLRFLLSWIALADCYPRL
jgi:hypothetical protein